MRTAEIQFEGVRASLLGAAHHLVPGLTLRLNHKRSDDQVLRIALLDFVNLAKINLGWAVADQLNIVEAHDLDAVKIDSAVTRTGVHDGLANRFPDGAAPARVERAHDLAAGVGRRAGSQPEWIRAGDSAEFHAEISHQLPPSFARRAKPRVQTARSCHALGDCVHDFFSAVRAIATGEIFGVAGLMPFVDL